MLRMKRQQLWDSLPGVWTNTRRGWLPSRVLEIQCNSVVFLYWRKPSACYYIAVSDFRLMQGRLSSGTTATQDQFIWHPEPCSHCRLVKMVFCATQVFTCGSHNGGWLVGRWSWSICSWINTTLATLKFRVGKNYGTSRGNWSLVSTVQRIEMPVSTGKPCFFMWLSGFHHQKLPSTTRKCTDLVLSIVGFSCLG